MPLGTVSTDPHPLVSGEIDACNREAFSSQTELRASRLLYALGHLPRLRHLRYTPTVYRFAQNEPLDIEQLRSRLRKMTDAALLGFGRAARNMCSPRANLGHPPRENFVV